MVKDDFDCGGSMAETSALLLLLPQQQVQLHGGVVEEFLDRLPDSDRVCSSVAAADVDGDCLRQHELDVVVVVVTGVVFASNREEVDGDAAATVFVDVLSLVGATEPAETTFDEGAVVVVWFEELPSTTIRSQPAAVTAGAVTVRVAGAASSLPASDCDKLPAAAVVKDSTVLVGCTALMLPMVADSLESWSCRARVTSGGGGVPAGDILDPAVCCCWLTVLRIFSSTSPTFPLKTVAATEAVVPTTPVPVEELVARPSDDPDPPFAASAIAQHVGHSPTLRGCSPVVSTVGGGL